MIESEISQLKNEVARLKADNERLTKELKVAKDDRDEAIKYSAKMREQVKGAYPKPVYNGEAKKWE